jgi:hypothetical protein
MMIAVVPRVRTAWMKTSGIDTSVFVSICDFFP